MAYDLLSNTPLTGHIAWSGVDIIYDGVSHEVANGSTSKKYAYWILSSPGVLQTSDSFPSIGEDDCVVFINNGGVGLSVLDASIIDGSLVIPGTIQSNAIMAEAITAGHIAAHTIVGEHVVLGSLIGDHLAANSITADRIDSRGLTIKDDQGNVLFGVGQNLDASLIDNLAPAVEQTVIDTVNTVAASYAVVIESTNGNIFKLGQGFTTTLKARVFRNGVEVTDSIPLSGFSWRRVSSLPLDDATWNATYMSGHRQIDVSASAETDRATFHCDVFV